MRSIHDTTAPQFDRMPPNAIEAEMCVLCSMILSGKERGIVAEIRATVTEDSFYQPDHRIIFGLLCELADSGKPLDAMILRGELYRRQLIDDVGGDGYIGEILSSAPSTAHGAHYAYDVQEAYLRRCLIRVANNALRDAYGAAAAGERSADLLQRAMTELANVTISVPQRAKTIQELVVETYEQLEQGESPLISTGFRAIDDVIGGYSPGEMWIFGARPSMGKSTFAKQSGVRIAKNGVPVVIFSLEEKNQKISRNILAAEALIENHKMRRPRLLEKFDWCRLTDAVARLGKLPLYCVDHLRKLADIRAEATRLVQHHGVRVVIIDYLGRVQAKGKDAYERTSLVSTGLSDLIKDLNVVGLVPAQLNRGVEGRQDKHPGMADLRDSGSIEQDADGIVFLHREDYYTTQREHEPEELKGVCELHIAKNRDGIRGKVIELKSRLKYQTFIDPSEVLETENPF